MNQAERRVVIVGDSIAGCTAARELRRLEHTGPITMIGADPDGCYARPPLSKHVLKSPDGQSEAWDMSDLDTTMIASPAAGLDTEERVLHTSDLQRIPYDELIVATGAAARRIAEPGLTGELVLRTRSDATELGRRLDTATSAIIVGAGFLGMEVASACAARGIAVTVVDVDAPLERILGPFLSDAIATRAQSTLVDFRRLDRPAVLIGDPVDGVDISGEKLHADLVVTCAGEVPSTQWLDGTGIADAHGIGIDRRCATTADNVFAAGDVTYALGSDTPTRTPFWSAAVAQGKVAAASALGVEPTCEPTDDYFWTEVLGLSIKVVGPLPAQGAPTILEGSVDDGAALLEWTHADGRKTVVAYGIKKPVGKLRRLASA